MTTKHIPVRQAAAWIEQELATISAEAAMLHSLLGTLAVEVSKARCHPHHDVFALGGAAHGAGLGVAHIGVLHWWLTRPWQDALSLLADDPAIVQPGFLLRRLPAAIERNPRLLIRGRIYLHKHGLLVDGRLPPKWLEEEGRFGLGLPLVAANLRAADQYALAGLWTLPLDNLTARLAALASETADSLAELLKPAIDADRDRLDVRGRRSTYLRARERYREDCARFAAFDAADLIKRWRALPPGRRQQFLAAVTGSAKSILKPNLETRGEAADWLRDKGANVRFRKENEK